MHPVFGEQALKWVSLVACVATALIGQAEVLPEPYRYIITTVAIVATAVQGFMIKGPESFKKE